MVLTAIIGALLLTGCSTACTAVGWIDSVTVNLAGDTAAVHRVQLCVQGTCSQDGVVPSAPETLHTVRPVPERSVPELSAGAATPAEPPAGAVPTSAPELSGPQPTSGPVLSGQRAGDTAWEFQVLGEHPQDVTVRVLDAEGGVLAEQDASLDWKRTGGSERCGGPHSTSPITVDLGS